MSKHHRHGHSGQQESSMGETGDTQTLAATTQEAPANGTENGDHGVMSALKSAREVAFNVRQRAVAGARATDEAVHNHPYKALAIAVGVGVILGMFFFRRSARKSD